MTIYLSEAGARRADPPPDGLSIGPGRPLPQGATVTADGVNFSVASASASRMALVLLDAETGSPTGEIPFPTEYRLGDVFTMLVRGLDPTTHYMLRADGPRHTPTAAFDPDTLLLDPYARRLVGGETWGERPRYRCAIPGAAAGQDFDWRDDRRPAIPREDLVVYELHVRGFTRHGSSGVSAPGTYAGLREKIPYLRWLGVNCVELMPVFEFDETDNTHHDPATGAPLRNLWGYNTVGFFAPKAGYAAHGVGDGPVVELKELIRDLHAAGIEVVLDVVFNHTAEGDHRGPTMSFRGLDNATYYMLAGNGEHYNYSGTGNTFNCNHPRVREFIVDCLRYWAVEYHVDGFRFDLASILARDVDGSVLANPPLLDELAHDPVLAHCKLIAEPWDAGGLYQVGSFPGAGRWMVWNGRYRDDLRRFLVGRRGRTGPLATRLVGSPDLYPGLPASTSVNFITSHDGFTLADWASYDRKHNEANGEGGRDGDDANESWNCGWEGETDDPAVRRLRRQQVRNALLLLLCSQGVPMLLAGDEFGRTQRGNNNTYCQDNELSWVDWSLADDNADLLAFVRRCLAFRRAHPLLRRVGHPTGETPTHWQYPAVSWHGTSPWEPDWSAGSGLLGALLYDGSAPDGPDAVLIVANSNGWSEQVVPPQAPHGTRWHLFADTAAAAPADAHEVGDEPSIDGHPQVAAHSVVVLVARRSDGGN